MMNKLQYKTAVKQFVLALFLVSLSVTLIAQAAEPDSTTINKKRLNTVIYGSIGAYALTMTGLYFIWYEDNLSFPFHFINDGDYWLQVDKLGHATTAYTISRYGYWSLRWANVPENKAIGYGALIGFGAMTTIEIFDGLSTDYGASWCDIAANTMGAGLFLGQQYLWHEQRFTLKFSYHPTEYAQYAPEKLGETWYERIIKDYNGQTYWLSANIESFIKKETKFPKWINIAVGYGADGMLAEVSNPAYDSDGNPLPEFNRIRQYYLSFDIDWTRIHTNSKFLKIVLKGLSFVKLPFPTVEYNSQDQFVFYWLYF